jgi:DNA sulfur modification protein DndB
MSISMFSDIQGTHIDLLVSDPAGFGNLEFNDEDSPVSIDAMASVQSGKLMFLASVKIGTLVGLLETEDPRLSIDQRRQRKPDLKRIPGMAEYLHGRPWAYSAITVALSGAFQFIPIKRVDGSHSRLGVLRIPRGYKTRSVIIDGQHRFLSLRAALGLEEDFSRYALPYEKQKSLADENMAVIFYAFPNDKAGVEWSQQYFHDLNCLGVSASRSLGIKFDRKTPINQITVRLAERCLPFIGRTEFEERQCGPNNPNLFTLSALKNATKYLLDDVSKDDLTHKYDTALNYWNRIGSTFPEWTTLEGNAIREKYVHGYGVALSALGLLGKHLLESHPNDFEKLLPRLTTINWLRWQAREDGSVQTTQTGDRVGNPFWNGFAMNGSTIQNTTSNIRNTGLLFRKTLGLPLTEQESDDLKALRTLNGML